MIEFSDVEEVFSAYSESYQRMSKLGGLAADASEVGAILWEALRRGVEGLADDDDYWDAMSEAPAESFSGKDVGTLLLAIDANAQASNDLDVVFGIPGWSYDLEDIVEKVLPQDGAVLLGTWGQLRSRGPLKMGLGCVLVLNGLMSKDDLPMAALSTSVAAVVRDTSPEDALERMRRIWSDEEVGRKLAMLGSVSKVGIWSTAWWSLAHPWATPKQRARWILNVDYASTAVAAGHFAALHFGPDDFAALRDELPALVALEAIDYWNDPPLQSKGFAAAAFALGADLMKRGAKADDLAAKTFERAVALKDDEISQALTGFLGVLESEQQERIVGDAFAKLDMYDRSRWQLLGTNPNPRNLARAIEAVTQFDRSESRGVEPAYEAFRALGSGAAETLLAAGWDKWPQRQILAAGLAATQNPIVAERLVELLEDSMSNVQELAIEGLTALAPQIAGTLVKALESRKKDVRRGAALALRAASLNEQQRAVVEELAANEKYDEVRVVLEALVRPDEPGNDEAMSFAALEQRAEELESPEVAELRRTLGQLIDDADADPEAMREAAGHGERFLVAVHRVLDRWWIDDEDRVNLWKVALESGTHSPLLLWTAVHSLSGFDDDGGQLQTQLIEMLRGAYGEGVVDPLLSLLEHKPDALLEPTIAWLVEHAPGRAGEWAKETLHAGDAKVRARAMAVLAGLGPDGADALAEMVGARRAEDRLVAIEFLTRSGGPETEAVLRAQLERERSRKVEEALRAAIFAIEARHRTPIAELKPTEANHRELDDWFAANTLPAPKNLDAGALPRLRWTSGEELSEAAQGWVLGRLGQKAEDADLQALRRHLTDESKSALLAGLREQFDDESDEGRIGWVLFASAILATDAEMLDFGRGLDEEARYGSSTKAFYHLDILRQHGAPAAIQWIDHWSRKARSRGLRDRATEALSLLAVELGITDEELSERVMSDYGFDARGRQTRAWGARGTMTLSLGAGNEVLLTDATGKQWKSYPGALKDDDENEIAALKAEVADLKKQVKQATKGQIERMEQAMITGRSWSASQWRDVYLSHPLIRNLARHVLWVAVDAAGAVVCVFRVDEELELADVEDEPISVDGLTVRVAHPLHMSDEERAAWGQIFADYELMLPFPQIERPVFAPTAEELKFDEVRRFADLSFETQKLRNHFERRLWLRGEAQDAGVVMWVSKSFRAAGVTAIVWVEPGFYVGYDDFGDDQSISRVAFLPIEDDYPSWRGDGVVPIASIDPVVFSEVVYDVQALADST